MKVQLVVSLIFMLASCTGKGQKVTGNAEKGLPGKEEVIDRYLKNGAWKYHYFSPQWQVYIDSAIAVNPSIAYLYQQKAMPLFKQRKYEAGMPILDKAVELAPMDYIDYRAFIKCVFAKTYHEAIIDFEQAKKIKGEEGYVMDHSYDFYIGLSYLQLNNFQLAHQYMEKSIKIMQSSLGERWVHHLDLLYAGIACQEMGKNEEAIAYFDRALVNYSNFSDVEYYKAISLMRLGQRDKAMELLKKCEADLKSGYTINEDNAIYETYPYQLKQWHIDVLRH